MGGKILLGYTGSWTTGYVYAAKKQELQEKLRKLPKRSKKRQELKRELAELKKGLEKAVSPVYATKEQYKKLQKLDELLYLREYL